MTRLLRVALILCAAAVALRYWAQRQTINMWDGSGL